MRVMHVALGGCLTSPPVPYGLTEDTGGHIAYILGAAKAQAARAQVSAIDIVTRRFDDPSLGSVHDRPVQRVCPKTRILRLSTDAAGYLDKSALEAELPALARAFLELLGNGPRPDVIHAHFSDAADLAFAARERFGIPVVYTPHSLGIDKAAATGARPALDRRIARERRAMQDADAIVVSSRDEAEAQVEAYGADGFGRTHRINPGVMLAEAPDGIDLARALVAPFLDEPDKPLILAVARPVAKKNLPALLRAYAVTPGLREAANLVILAGQHDSPALASGEQRGQLDALKAGVDRWGLAGRVALPPCHDGAQVTQLYRLAAERRGVFANPALHEPFGLTVTEAAACGLPVVATRNGGPADILSEIGHGRAVDPRDTAEIGAALLEAVTDRALWDRRSRAARANLGPYSWSRYAQRLEGIYARLARPRVQRTADEPLRPALRRAAARQVLVCDIDNTLTGSRPAARRFGRWAQTRAIPFLVATGRSLTEARRVLALWDLPEPDIFITSVGTEIYLPDAAGRAALDRSFADRLAPGWDGEAVEAVVAGLGVTPQARIEQRRFKRSYLGTTADGLAITRALTEAGLDCNVVVSHERLIDVLPRGAGKAAAIDHAARSMGLDLADCIACGDSGNDACMLRAAGSAILVGNALPEIARMPARAGLIRARAHHADGVLEGLARLGLNDVAPPRMGRRA